MMSKEYDLQIYVDRLFANRPKTREAMELKREILSNLEARVADEMEHGMDRQAAVALAIGQMEDIGDLIGDRRQIHVLRYRYDLLQSAMIYLLLAWIMTLPARLLPSGMLINSLLLCLAILVGAMYLSVSSHLKRDDGRVAIIDSVKLTRWHAAAWTIWALFMLVSFAYTFILHFGTDIWFQRALKLDGPYSFYVVAVEFAIPLVSIIVPILVRRAAKLTERHEVSEA